MNHSASDTISGNRPGLQPTLFIGAGAAFNKVEITGSKTYLETQVDHTTRVSPALVFGVKFYNKKNQGNFLILPAIRFFSIYANGEVNLTSGLAHYAHESTFESKLVINPSANLGYRLINLPSIKWHVSAGIAYSFYINASETQVTKYSSGDQMVLAYTPAALTFVFNGETGVDFGKRFGIWFCYQPPVDTSDLVTKEVKNSTLQAGICWNFHVAK